MEKNSKNARHPGGERRGSAQPARNVQRSGGAKKRPVNSRPQQEFHRDPRSSGRAPAQSREQRRRTDRAYRQATVQREVKSRRRSRRGGNLVMYYILAAAVIITVLIILSNTVLFSCSAIEVTGNSRYTAQQIVMQSGLETGQNLLHIDASAAANRISAAFPYIDKVEVQKSFPTKINIVVQEAEKWYQVSSGGVNAAISRLGRIVELGSTEGLTVVEGYEPEDLVPGKILSSKDNGKTQIPAQILEAAEAEGITGVTRINMTDRFDISIDCGNNITLQIGGISDLSVKLAEAASAMEIERANVYIDLRTQEKMFVRDKVVEQVLPDIGNTSESTAESTAEAGTSEQ